MLVSEPDWASKVSKGVQDVADLIAGGLKTIESVDKEIERYRLWQQRFESTAAGFRSHVAFGVP